MASYFPTHRKNIPAEEPTGWHRGDIPAEESLLAGTGGTFPWKRAYWLAPGEYSRGRELTGWLSLVPPRPGLLRQALSRTYVATRPNTLC
eukprot:1187035-Prorocentrum_minimum.AAC.1